MGPAEKQLRQEVRDVVQKDVVESLDEMQEHFAHVPTEIDYAHRVIVDLFDNLDADARFKVFINLASRFRP
jgi:hypothetical protein